MSISRSRELYGDLVHGDHEKGERLDVVNRYRAAVAVFSGVGRVALAKLILIRQLDELEPLGLPEGVFIDPVIVAETNIEIECSDAWQTEVGADLGNTDDMLRGGPPPAHFRPVLDDPDDVV